MKLGEMISQIERWTGTSINDPTLLDREVTLIVNSEEADLDSVDYDTGVIVLGD
jgi:hypothetical protein